MSEPEPGLRERKKQRTRQSMIDAAKRLYIARGFDAITVADIVHEADVSQRTFFTHFECKEDVFLGPGDARIQRLIDAIRARNRDEPILTAVARVLLHDPGGKQKRIETGRPELTDLLRHRAIANRLRERWIRWEDMLAAAIAEDVGVGPDDPEPRVAAAALTGAIRSASAAADLDPQRRTEIAARAFGLLESGMATYGAGKQPPPPAVTGSPGYEQGLLTQRKR